MKGQQMIKYYCSIFYRMNYEKKCLGNKFLKGVFLP